MLQGEKYFRGSSRELPFGAFPSVGAFPLVRHDDYCMAHPEPRLYTLTRAEASAAARDRALAGRGRSASSL